MNEQLLQFIWQQKALLHEKLLTTAGDEITVIHPGSLNTDSGPDFFNARISINGTVWAGNVEVHIRSADWLRHGHQYDRAYDNVILHVVYEHDAELFNG